MLGMKFIKIPPTTYVLQYKAGAVVREGVGLSFFYYTPTTSLVLVPLESVDVPFIFAESTADFQEVTVQGQIAYRIADAKRTAQLLNFTIDRHGRYVSDDPEKLPQRIVNLLKVLVRKEINPMPLRDALRSSERLTVNVTTALTSAPELNALGVSIVGVSILAIKPTPETTKALEAEAREMFLREADAAIHARRVSAVEQERVIKESELNTEVAVENKRRQVREAQMEAERVVQEKQHELQRAELDSRVSLEERRKDLVALSVENARHEADAKAYAMGAMVKSLAGLDPRALQSLASVGMQPNQLIALAFQGIADKADKIGELNISPELLRELMDAKKK
jgi:regulator of protease activity HflC (stomatin/prohibitin superfamily)